ncbi:hypothetical protein C8Q77DRAFT_1158886 [Trametes polyzona]|nr:hypothetical protein C8Q77DRAFT_1158886 [Trametes polyzona]
MFSSKLTASLTLLVAAASTASAMTTAVFRPVITSPQAGEFWAHDSDHTVTWDPPVIPAGGVEQRGDIWLGYWDPFSVGQHLDFAHPLATNVSVLAGSVDVHIPNPKPRTSYIIVAFESSVMSPEFTIG